jgi:AraC-like DNA-binding protein
MMAPAVVLPDPALRRAAMLLSDSMVDRRAELRELIARHAPGQGTAPSALPILRFNRSERPLTFTSGHVPALMLAVVAQGKKICRVGDREYHYDTDTYFVFTGETEFASSVLEASRERPYLSMSLQLPAEDIVRALLSLGQQASTGGAAPDEPPAFAAPLCPAIVDALCRLIRTLDDPAERLVLAPLIITELVFRLLRTDAAERVRQAAGRCADHARIDQAMAFMRANLQRRLSVAAVARHVAMSPSHFAHRFREVARTSPMHYLKQARLHAARLSMINDGKSPAEVAVHVGYQSPAHFSRDFKTYFALPPATYVRQFRAAGDASRSQDPARRSQASASPSAPA